MNAQPFIVVAVFALAIGGFVWLIFKGRQIHQQQGFERKVQSRKLGWRYDDTRDGRIDYRFDGATDGIEWAMWYDSDRGDDSPRPKAYWQSANVRTPRLSLVIIGRKRYQMESGVASRLLMDVVTGVAQALNGDRGHASGYANKSEFYESAITLDEGSAGLRERFAVAVSPDMPRGWLDAELEALLVNWPKPRRGTPYRSDENVEVSLRPDGLQIVAQQMPEEFAFWNHLAQLGEALAQRLGGLAGR